jgi:hypothetical protein
MRPRLQVGTGGMVSSGPVISRSAASVRGGRAVAGERLAQAVQPPLRRGPPGLGQRQRLGVRQVDEPAPGAVGVHQVTEGAGGTVADVQSAAGAGQPRLGQRGRETEQAGVLRAGGGRVDEGAHRGADAVRADQDVGALLGAVVEAGGDAVTGVLGGHQPLAVPGADTAAGGLVVQRPVQLAAPDEAGRRQAGRQGDLAERLAVRAVQDGAAHGGADPADDVAGADRVEGVDSVGGQAQAAADAVGGDVVRLADAGFDARALKRHGRGRAGDATADDQCGTDVGGHNSCLGRSGAVGRPAAGRADGFCIGRVRASVRDLSTCAG